MSDSGRRLVFSYGSNMSIARIRARVSSVRVVETAVLAGHCLRFHKKHRDGSGKADAYRTGDAEDRVYGVVQEVSVEEKQLLDHIEGAGREYEDASVEVLSLGGRLYRASAYRAMPHRIEPTLRPYTWYKGFVSTGAAENNLPAEYRAIIDRVDAFQDPDLERHERATLVLSMSPQEIRR